MQPDNESLYRLINVVPFIVTRNTIIGDKYGRKKHVDGVKHKDASLHC
jgi:hypothetical protein